MLLVKLFWLNYEFKAGFYQPKNRNLIVKPA